MPTFTATCLLIPILVFFLVLDFNSKLAQSTQEGDGVCAGFTKPTSCPINCFRADPVCGINGVTYWCGCPDASCAGVQVAKSGFCEVGSGGTSPLSAARKWSICF